MRATNPDLSRACALLLLLLLPGIAAALPSDKEKPVYLEADEADIDDKRGVSVYRGDVVVTRGSLRITGDHLTIYNTPDGGDIEKAIVLGKLATYQSQPKAGGEIVYGEGDRIEYYGTKDEAILIGHAKVTQKKNTFTGARILYNLKTDTVKGMSQPATEAASGEERRRVRIIFHPKPTAQAAPAVEMPAEAPAEGPVEDAR